MVSLSLTTMASSNLTKINITNDIHLRRDHTMIPKNKGTQNINGPAKSIQAKKGNIL